MSKEKELKVNKEEKVESKIDELNNPFLTNETAKEIEKFATWVRIQAIFLMISGGFSIFAFIYIFPLVYGTISIISGILLLNAVDEAEKATKSKSIEESHKNIIEVLSKFKTIAKIKVIADIVTISLSLLGIIAFILIIAIVGSAS